MSAKLILIASYPKSGNTWVRIFLDRLMHPDGGHSINALDAAFYGHARRLSFDDHAPAPAAELRQDEIEAFMPDVIAAVSREYSHPVPVKTHDRARQVRGGRWLFPPEQVRAVLHLVRHPFDVTVSYARHRGVSLARSAADLRDEGHQTAPTDGRLPLPLTEQTGSWSSHTESWLANPAYPVTTLRYEDLCLAPEANFRRLAEAAGFTPSAEALSRAIEQSGFSVLQREEAAQGFRERPKSSPAFFRSGRPLASAGLLDAGLREQLIACHGAAMRRLGYTHNGGMLTI